MRDELTAHARATWRSFEALLVGATGLPADFIGGELASGTRARFTSPTDVAVYLWALLAARDLGFMSASEAEQRARRTLDSLTALERHAASGQFSPRARPSSTPDTTTVPSTPRRGSRATSRSPSARCRRSTTLPGGVHPAAPASAPRAPGSPAIGARISASRCWAARAWQASGASCRAGVAACSRRSCRRSSCRRSSGGPRSWGLNHRLYVEAQIAFGLEQLGCGYWGFSPASDPAGGYREYGVPALGMAPEPYSVDGRAGSGSAPRSIVVTPHAAFLALDFAAEAALANLARLRRDFPGLYGAGGFKDAVDVTTGRIAERYLALDQGMVLAACANALTGDRLQSYLAPSLEPALEPLMRLEEFCVGVGASPAPGG